MPPSDHPDFSPEAIGARIEADIRRKLSAVLLEAERVAIERDGAAYFMPASPRTGALEVAAILPESPRPFRRRTTRRPPFMPDRKGPR